MTKHRLVMYLVMIVAAFALSACGGGDDTTASSQWDTMKWDQGQWK